MFHLTFIFVTFIVQCIPNIDCTSSTRTYFASFDVLNGTNANAWIQWAIASDYNTTTTTPWFDIGPLHEGMHNISQTSDEIGSGINEIRFGMFGAGYNNTISVKLANIKSMNITGESNSGYSREYWFSYRTSTDNCFIAIINTQTGNETFKGLTENGCNDYYSLESNVYSSKEDSSTLFPCMSNCNKQMMNKV